MAAYAALVSLMNLIDEIECHPSPPISLDKQQLMSLTTKVSSLQEFLEGYNSPVADGDEADPLEIRIADAANRAQDVIASYIKNKTRLAAQLLDYGYNAYTNLAEVEVDDRAASTKLYEDVENVIEELDLIKEEAAEMATNAQLQRNLSARGGHGSSSTDLMVGFDGMVLELLEKLTVEIRQLQIIPVIGMGGIGKTTLTRHVYAHPYIREHFDIWAWATISQQYNAKDILFQLLSQANKKSKEELSNKSEDELGLSLYQYLCGRRFLIVMDDMWNIEVWGEMQRFFPDNNNKSRVLVTTRLSKLGCQLANNYSLEMKFLDEVSSWDLFSKYVFGEESCPLELVEIGKKIVENCKGLPLSIVVLRGLLRKMEQSLGFWESIRENSSSVVNSANEDFCLKILKMSYNHLPMYMKPCFLYMGVFEEDRAVRVTTLIKLWVSEGFVKPVSGESLETTAKEYLNELVDRNLILVHELGSIGNMKRCKIHDLLRDLCWRQAEKEGFYNVIGKHKLQGLYRQRCVVIPASISKEEVDKALQSMPLARSFICHGKQVVPLPESGLLRTLKAYDRDTSGSHDYLLRDLFRSVNSRYLSVGTQYHKLEFRPSISLLWNLHTLIIFHSGWLTEPYKIWDMPQLRHFELYKGDLDLKYPWHRSNVIMENLQTLKGVSVSYWSMPQTVFPNVKKLGITCKDIPDVCCLTKLESFRCWGIHFVSVYNFPYSLKKLSLGSSTTYWDMNEEMQEKIGALPLLQKLTLERARFKRKVWNTRENQFPSLKFLELNCCLLESWNTDISHFPCLEKLRLYGMKELAQIPCEIGEISTLQSVLLEYCSRSMVESAKMTQEQDELKVRVVLFNNNNNEELLDLASDNFLVEIDDF